MSFPTLKNPNACLLSPGKSELINGLTVFHLSGPYISRKEQTLTPSTAYYLLQRGGLRGAVEAAAGFSVDHNSCHCSYAFVPRAGYAKLKTMKTIEGSTSAIAALRSYLALSEAA